jgi:hypothetical protein
MASALLTGAVDRISLPELVAICSAAARRSWYSSVAWTPREDEAGRM